MKATTNGFEELGLSASEANALESLITDGPATGSALAVRLGVQKSVSYFLCEQLAGKGLANCIIVNNRREYRAPEPELLQARMNGRRKEFAKNLSRLDSLMKAGTRRRKGATFKVFEGWDGLKHALDDVLKTHPKEINSFSMAIPLKHVPRFRRLIGKWHAKRAALGIQCNIFFSPEMQSTLGADRKKDDHTKVRFVKLVDPFPAAAIVYENKLTVIMWTEAPLVISMESKDLANWYKNLFDLIWKTAKP
ncbi:TPA: hypothetical protein HA318_00320 [Candidatus Micrarchaeota archaeon]|nr:MAG: hypothetical protein AUJ65_04470 [Candidatus Micrarchaeota archaeon CG1_02_51_15]HII38435.1 hypothetical protein [Candidatus Micrarchaeota archaeon]